MSTSEKKKVVDQTLTDIYYQPTHMWRGDKAIELLLKKQRSVKKNGLFNGFHGKHYGRFFYLIQNILLDVISI